MEMKLELALVTSDKQRKSLDEASVPEIVTLFLDGKFEAALQTNYAKQILSENTANEESLETCIVNNVKHFMSSGNGDNQTSSREVEVLAVGACCLQLFVQNNWTGPATLTAPSAVLHANFADNKEVQEKAVTYLGEDGEPAYTRSQYAVLLQLAKVIFLDCRHSLTALQLAKVIFLDCRHSLTALQTREWWLSRCLMVQQALLEQRSPTLKDAIFQAHKDIAEKEVLIECEDNRDAAILFHIEAAQMCQFYWDNKGAQAHVVQAQKLAGLQVELTGALGKRTRFQQEAKAQLIVKVTRSEDGPPLPPVGLCDPECSPPVPKSLQINDDTVLDDIDFSVKETDVTRLSPLENALLYIKMETYRRALSQDRLTHEEVTAYLERIISGVSNWSVSVSAHTLRSNLEQKNMRRVERSMRQLEELFNQTTRSDPPPTVRLQLFYAAMPPTVWVIQSQLAGLLVSLGILGEALKIYERLELWEDVINCYKLMAKLNKAESVIREQLDKKVTPTLLCFLGDVTCDKTHYEHAWEISNHRNSRAMRCLGYIHFREERYDQAVECFERSLAINYLQIPVWFTCGCASLTAGKYESAVKAFKRCVNIDYDNFEAWSNLATAYAKLKKKREAFLTVKEAIKCSFENWRLWENCLVFAADCGEFEEAIRAYSHMLDLKEKFIDVVLCLQFAADCGEFEEAIRVYSHMLDLKEKFIDVVLCLQFAADCGEFEEAIRAYSHMLDLKEKFIDVVVLQVLVKAVVGNMDDAEGRPAGRLLPKLLELFGRMTTMMTVDSDTWKLYAELSATETPGHPADQEKVADLLQKAHRCVTLKSNWERLPEDCEKVAQDVLELIKVLKTCTEQTEEVQKRKEFLNRMKFTIRGVCSAIKLKHTDPATQELAEPLKSRCDTLDKEMESVMEQLEKLWKA
ncbi:hypothetical protein ACOMHN_026991 [Nucella lapillus]